MQHRPVPRTIRVIKFFLRPLLMVFTKRDWQGMENLPEGGFVLAPNHLSHLDPFLIALFMLDNNIPPQFLAKDTLVEREVVRLDPADRRADPGLPQHRRGRGVPAGRVAAVEAGKVVTIYPEGTITRDPAAWPMTGRTGAVRVALATGKPLVPLMQWGPQEILWPYAKKVRLLPRKTIHIRVGKPIDLSAYAGKPLTEDVLHEATELLMDTLTTMMAEVRGELPSTPRIDVHTLSKPRSNYKR